MQNIESAGRDAIAGRIVGFIEMGDQQRGAAMLGPGEQPVVVFGHHGIDLEPGVAVPAGKEHDIVASCGEPARQEPAVSLHAAPEGLRDRLSHMGEQSDPHVRTGSACRRRSSSRMTVAEFA